MYPILSLNISRNMAFMVHLSHLYLFSFAKQVVITFTFCFDGKYQEETTGVYNGWHHANKSDTAHDKQQSISQSCLYFCLCYIYV
jgi:hypothetical protein